MASKRWGISPEGFPACLGMRDPFRATLKFLTAIK
jgi:hypothetical protein